MRNTSVRVGCFLPDCSTGSWEATVILRDREGIDINQGLGPRAL